MKKYYNNILYEMAAESAVLGGGGSGNVDHDINVSLEGFDSAKAAITSARTEIENAVTKAGTAINDAKGACDADIAAAIEEGISAPDLKNLNQAFADLENLLKSVTKLDSTYNTQKSRLLNAIRGAQSGTGAGGGSNSTVNMLK